MDFNRTQIDVITVETNGPGGKAIIPQLEGKGFVNVFKTRFDHVFIHRDAEDKMAWFEQWNEKKK